MPPAPLPRHPARLAAPALLALALGCSATPHAGVGLPVLSLSDGGFATVTDAGACSLSVDFGQVPGGFAASATVLLSNVGSDSLSLVGERSAGTGNIVLKLPLPHIVAPGQQLAIALSDDTPLGPINGSTVVSTDSAACPEIVLSYQGNGVYQCLALTPPGALDFGSVKVGAQATRSLTFSSLCTVPLTLTSARMDGTADAREFTLSALTALAPIVAGAPGELQVNFAPTVLERRAQSTVVFDTSLPGQATSMALLGEPTP